jgi:hypothetical protein
MSIENPFQQQQAPPQKGIEALNQEKINHYIDSRLEGEDDSLIEQPMEPTCKVSIMIPAYNESADNILRSLTSLVSQEGVEPEQFETVIIVNNNESEAEHQSEAFLNNQETLALINFINGTLETPPEWLSSTQLEAIQRIKEKKIRVSAIDKSSPETAEEENNVGIARDRAAAEICQRFMSVDAKTNGIIALADCDSSFSENFVRALIDSFEQNNIKGVSGNLEFTIDPNLPNKDLVQKAFDIYMGRKKSTTDYADAPTFVEQDSGALMSGTNMAVSVKSMGLVEGIPPQAGGEDINFGKKVENLPGKVAKNYDYTITTRIRASERTGVQGNGRIVKKMSDSIEAFLEGRSQGIFIEDKEAVNTFFSSLIQAQKQGQLTGKFIIEKMKQYKFKETPSTETEFDSLANIINQELEKPEAEQDLKKVEGMILEKIYPYYPEKDITELLDL